jgi:hypothetical protein
MMPEDPLKALLGKILNTQEGCQKMIIGAQEQLNALTSASMRLDSRIAALYSEELEIEKKRQAALLEQYLKDIALLRAVVPRSVN